MTPKSKNLAIFLPNRQDVCGYTSNVIINLRNKGAMDRRTDNLSFMYAPIHVGFILVSVVMWTTRCIFSQTFARNSIVKTPASYGFCRGNMTKFMFV